MARLFRVSKSPTIYEESGGVVRPFLGEKPFLEKGYQFGQEQTISPDQLSQYKLGQPYGSQYLKTADNPTVYQISGGIKRPIESEQAYQQLTGGLDWSKVATVSPALLGKYATGEMIKPQNNLDYSNIYNNQIAGRQTLSGQPLFDWTKPTQAELQAMKSAQFTEPDTNLFRQILTDVYGEIGRLPTHQEVEHHLTTGGARFKADPEAYKNYLMDWIHQTPAYQNTQQNVQTSQTPQPTQPMQPPQPEQPTLSPEDQKALTDIKNIMASVSQPTQTIDKERKGLFAKLGEAIRSIPKKRIEERKKLYAEAKIPEKEKQLADWNKKLAETSARYEKAYLDVANQPIRYSAIVGQQGLVRRMEAAELKGIAAVKDAISGSLDRAYKLAGEALNDQVAVEQANVDALKAELDATGEARNIEEAKQKTMLEYMLKKETERLSDEKNLADKKLAVMVKYPQADIRTTDDWETITEKIKKVLDKKEEKNLMKNLGMVYDPFKKKYVETLASQKLKSSMNKQVIPKQVPLKTPLDVFGKEQGLTSSQINEILYATTPPAWFFDDYLPRLGGNAMVNWRNTWKVLKEETRKAAQTPKVSSKSTLFNPTASDKSKAQQWVYSQPGHTQEDIKRLTTDPEYFYWVLSQITKPL